MVAKTAQYESLGYMGCSMGDNISACGTLRTIAYNCRVLSPGWLP
jgi:hypothetical protein